MKNFGMTNEVAINNISSRRYDGAEAIERILKRCDTEDHRLMNSFGDAYARNHEEEMKSNCSLLGNVIFGIG